MGGNCYTAIAPVSFQLDCLGMPQAFHVSANRISLFSIFIEKTTKIEGFPSSKGVLLLIVV